MVFDLVTDCNCCCHVNRLSNIKAHTSRVSADLGVKLVGLMQAKTPAEGEAMNREGSRNIRTGGLRFWATLLQRFPEGMDYNQFWGPFLIAVEPQMERMAVEVGRP